MIKFFNSALFKQYAVVFTVNLNLILFGMATSWTSPAIVKLRSENDTVLHRPITDYEASWIVSVPSLSNIFSNLLAGYVADRFGRKGCVILSCLPKITACFIYIFTSQVWMLLLSRALEGMSESLAIIAVPMYTAEISSKDIRGALGTIFQFCCSLGIVIMLSVGPYTSYVKMNTIYLIMTIAATIPSFFLPESPYILHKKGQRNKSKQILIFLRGSEAAAEAEIKEYTKSENETVKRIELLKDKTVLKSLALVAFLGFGTQFTGYNAVAFYLQTILESTKTSIAPELASVIIGLIQLISSVCTALVSDRIGRKPILITTMIGMIIGMCGMGTFFYMKEAGYKINQFLDVLPLLSLTVIVFCFGAGLGSIYWPLTAELLDGPARAMGVSISLFTNTLTQFFFTKYMLAFTSAVGPAITYWVFAVNSVFICLFIVFFIPETNKKTFGEIQLAIGGKCKKIEVERL